MARLEEPLVHWWGMLADNTGYANEARSFIQALRDYPIRQCITPMLRTGESQPIDPDYQHVLGEYLASAGQVRAGLTIIHAPWASPWPTSTNSTRRVWRTMFETQAIPNSWVEATSSVDQVWVPSAFNRETFSDAGVPAAKIRIVPEPIDTARYRPATSLHGRGDEFTFLSVFRWHRRKGWDVLLDAYIDEFNSSDDVRLVIRADPFEGSSGNGVQVRA